MHVLEKYTGDNVTSLNKFSFSPFFCQLSLIKFSILTYFNSALKKYQYRRSQCIYFNPSKTFKHYLGQDILIPIVSEFIPFDGTLANFSNKTRRFLRHGQK